MAEEPEDVDRTNAPRPTLRQRKSSFSDALSKFTSKTFSRRETPAGLPISVSTVSMNQQSRLPTPSGIPKSSSFFSSLNSFATKSSSSSVNRSETSQPPLIKRPRKISERLASTPFFSLSSQQQRVPTAPILTNPIHRETTVKIETRGLMQPVAPPLPRSSTIANLATIYSSPHTPGYMRPTSSSAARRGSLTGSKQVNTPMATITSRQPPLDSPTHRRRTPSSRFPVRKDSLPPAPTSKSVKTGRKYSMLPTPVPQNRNPLHEDTLPSPPRRSSMKRRQLLRESETLPNMKVRSSGGQDSGVAFERDDEVQRRFDQYNTTMDLSSIDHTNTSLLITRIDDTEDTTASESNEDTVLHRTCTRDPIPDPSNPRQVSKPSHRPSTHHLTHPTPPDPLPQTPPLLARPLHRPLRPLPHLSPPLPSPLSPQLLHSHSHSLPHLLNRPRLPPPPHARRSAPQPPHIHPFERIVRDGCGEGEFGGF